MKLKHIARAVVLALLLAFAINICYNALSWKDTTGGYLSAYEQLYNTPANTMDVVFVGTSHVYCGVYPSILWRDYGISSFDMAVAGQDKMSAYYATKELLKTQKPKVVIVDLFSLYYKDQPVAANEYRNLLGMKYSLNLVDLIENYNANYHHNRKDYYLRFPIIHTRYRELTRYDFDDYPQSVYGKGEDIYFVNSDGYDGSFLCNNISNEKEELTEIETIVLEDWVKLAEANGFEVVFTLLPAMIPEELQKKINSVESWADNNGIRFLDLNRSRLEIGLNSGEEFFDIDHLNAYGAEKLTKYIYQNILREYELIDHRGDILYESWDKNARRLEHEMILSDLETINTVNDYFSIMSQSKEMQFLVGINEADNNAERFSAFTTCYGIAEEEVNQGGVWLCKDGVAAKIEDKAIDKGIVFEMGRFDCAKLYRNNALEYVIDINDKRYNVQGNRVLISGYDNLLGKTIEKRDFIE